jgi:hypothetical protein
MKSPNLNFYENKPRSNPQKMESLTEKITYLTKLLKLLIHLLNLLNRNKPRPMKKPKLKYPKQFKIS